MDKFHAIRVFIEVADLNGFASAARKLNMSPPGVTRAVSMLENELGTRLLVRTTRFLRLTDAGKRFLADARRILIDLEEAENAAIGSHATPQGELRITAPVLFGKMFVTPILAQYLNLYSQVSARTLFVDRVVNLMDEGLDVAVRIGELPDSSLTAMRCGSVRQVVFASSRYIAEHGAPQHPQNLATHQIIQSVAIADAGGWLFEENGKPCVVHLEPRVRMNTNDAVIEMVAHGHGISQLLSYQIGPYLADGTVQALLSGFELPPLPVHILHQEGRMVSAKVRSFTDFMVEKLRADPQLNFHSKLHP
jgi:DNA-binding transcriptional LysR family regulator